MGTKIPQNSITAKKSRFWEASPHTGRRKKYTPAEFAKGAKEYFLWTEENPLYEQRITTYQGVSEIVEIEKMRAMTINGLCNFLGISQDTWDNYIGSDGYEEYFDICAKVRSIIYQQKFEGAAADLLNANIISREIGLAEKREHTVEPLDYKKLSDEDLTLRIKELQKMKELSA